MDTHTPLNDEPVSMHLASIKNDKIGKKEYKCIKHRKTKKAYPQ